MKNVEEQKVRLKQKKARVAIEETRLKLKERKMRTRHLIEVGGLITKAGLDHLPTNALYGALLSIKKALDDNKNVISGWIKLGSDTFNLEAKSTTAVILKFNEQPSEDLRKSMRSHGLRYNRFRSEWYGNITDLDSLKQRLKGIQYNLEIIE